MLNNATKLRLKDIACRVKESSDLLPGEEDFLLSMAEHSQEAKRILDDARGRVMRNGVSGE